MIMKKRYFILVLVLILVVAVLFGCLPGNEGGGDSSSGNENILGEDSNGDGVWDDVGDAILEKYPDDEGKRAVLTEYAKAQQAFLLSENESVAIAHAHADKTLDCIYYLYPYEEAREIVESFIGEIANTEERISAQIKAEGYLGGEIFEAPSDEELEIICKQ
ncbi:MAG: hypothetical protein ABFQ65_03810 [Nanoarchaeota archaeon]